MVLSWSSIPPDLGSLGRRDPTYPSCAVRESASPSGMRIPYMHGL